VEFRSFSCVKPWHDYRDKFVICISEDEHAITELSKTPK
jgi:hypothetical protein